MAYRHESWDSFAISCIFLSFFFFLHISFPYSWLYIRFTQCLRSESCVCLSQRFIKYELLISSIRTERFASNAFTSPSLEQFFGSVWCFKQIKTCKYNLYTFIRWFVLSCMGIFFFFFLTMPLHSSSSLLQPAVAGGENERLAHIPLFQEKQNVFQFGSNRLDFIQTLSLGN